MGFVFVAALLLAQAAGPEKMFQDALAAQQRGDDATAIRLYQALVKSHPDVPEVRANLGAVLARQGRFDEAIEQYRAALTRTANSPAVRMNLAIAYYKKGAIADAVRELHTLRGADPANVRVATLLGDCYLRQGKAEDAIALLAPMETSNPGDLALAYMLGTALIRDGKLNAGLQRVEKVARQGNSAEAYLLAGQTALKLDDFERARDLANAAVTLNPKLPGVLTLQGTALQYVGDNAGAIASLRKALEANPNDFDAHLNLGGILNTERDLEGARRHIERALQLQPDSIVARYELARVKRSEGSLEDAVRDFEAVVKAKPDWAQPHIELSALYFRVNRPQDGEREKATFDKLSEGSPKAQRR